MSTYEDSLLAARFAAMATAPLAGDWDEILGRAGAARAGRQRLAGRRRRRLLVAFAMAAVVAVAAAAAVGAVRYFVLDRGFIGLPPLGATPSSPANGELEIFFWVTPSGPFGRTRAWVYDDGRLIWLREDTDIPEAANPLSTGFLEQRLTPEGVQLLKSEIASAGKFGGDDDAAPPPSKPPCPKDLSPDEGNCLPRTPPPAPDEPIAVPFYTHIAVRDLGRLVHVDRAKDLERLEARLSDPSSWLPAGAWADRDLKAYVARKYRVCYSSRPPDEPVEQADLVRLFPAATRDLLSSASPRQGPLFGSPGHFRPSREYCFDAKTDGARALVGALDNAGLERQGAYRLSYQLASTVPNKAEASIYFEPYLPHGTTTCAACG